MELKGHFERHLAAATYGPHSLETVRRTAPNWTNASEPALRYSSLSGASLRCTAESHARRISLFGNRSSFKFRQIRKFILNSLFRLPKK